MYGNVDADLLWLRLLARYLINECNLKRRNDDSCIFYKKNDKEKSELVMSVHVDDEFIYGKLDTLKNTKEKVKKKFNIQESRKVNNFLGVYYEWGHDAKGTYVKMTI